MNILVTGAQGQLGRSLEHLVSARKCTGVWKFASHADLDITDSEAVQDYITRHHIHVIINCAAYTAVDLAESEPEAAYRLNAEAPGFLAKAAKMNDAMLIHISTDYVFSGEGIITDGQLRAYQEADTPAPVTVYGKSKLAGEEKIIRSGCRYLIFRTAWLYSPYGKNFVKTMLKLTAERQELMVVDDQTGTPTNARNLARMILELVENEDKPGLDQTGIYHYTDDGVSTWYDFACEIARLSGHCNCKINPCTTKDYPTPAKRPAFSLLDKTKVCRTFGIQLQDWKTALKEFIQNDRQEI